MLSKQEIIELLRYPIYKVKLRLQYDPYEDYDYAVHSEGFNWEQHNLHCNLFNYMRTQESIRKKIFDKGCITYYLQVRNDEVYQVSGEILTELGRTVEVGTTTIKMILRDGGHIEHYLQEQGR